MRDSVTSKNSFRILNKKSTIRSKGILSQISTIKNFKSSIGTIAERSPTKKLTKETDEAVSKNCSIYDNVYPTPMPMLTKKERLKYSIKKSKNKNNYYKFSDGKPDEFSFEIEKMRYLSPQNAIPKNREIIQTNAISLKLNKLNKQAKRKEQLMQLIQKKKKEYFGITHLKSTNPSCSISL